MEEMDDIEECSVGNYAWNNILDFEHVHEHPQEEDEKFSLERTRQLFQQMRLASQTTTPPLYKRLDHLLWKNIANSPLANSNNFKLDSISFPFYFVSSEHTTNETTQEHHFICSDYCFPCNLTESWSCVDTYFEFHLEQLQKETKNFELEIGFLPFGEEMRKDANLVSVCLAKTQKDWKITFMMQGTLFQFDLNQQKLFPSSQQLGWFSSLFKNTSKDVFGIGITNGPKKSLFFTRNGQLQQILPFLFNEENTSFELYTRVKYVVSKEGYNIIRFQFTPHQFQFQTNYSFISHQQTRCAFPQIILETLLPTILSYCNSASDYFHCGILNKSCYQLAFANLPSKPLLQNIWKVFVMERWPNMSKTDLNISHWSTVYKRRSSVLLKLRQKRNNNSTAHFIENCYQWEFKCPLVWENLQTTNNKDVNFCKVCQKNVYVVNSPVEMEYRIKMKDCICFKSKYKKHMGCMVI